MPPEDVWPAYALGLLVAQAEHFWGVGPSDPKALSTTESSIRSRYPGEFVTEPEYLGTFPVEPQLVVL